MSALWAAGAELAPSGPVRAENLPRLESPPRLEEELDGWVRRSLLDAHRELDSGHRWDFVANVYESNTYHVCVHLDRDDVCDGPLFPYSYEENDPNPNPVDPSEVLRHFAATPTCVRCIYISGVDEMLIRDKWADCIDTGRRGKPGGGYMGHWMWTLPEYGNGSADDQKNWICMRETSFNFGWPEYPGDRGTEW